MKHNERMVFSHLAGREVSNYSPEWIRECECMHLINNYPTREQKHYYLYGVSDRKLIFRFNEFNGRPELRSKDELRELWGKDNRPMMQRRGLQACDDLLADAKRLYEATRK